MFGWGKHGKKLLWIYGFDRRPRGVREKFGWRVWCQKEVWMVSGVIKVPRSDLITYVSGGRVSNGFEFILNYISRRLSGGVSLGMSGRGCSLSRRVGNPIRNEEYECQKVLTHHKASISCLGCSVFLEDIYVWVSIHLKYLQLVFINKCCLDYCAFSEKIIWPKLASRISLKGWHFIVSIKKHNKGH